MKLWDKGYSVKKEVEDFTVGKDRILDAYLAKYDVIGSIAHAKMLSTVGLLTTDEYIAIEKALQDILIEIESGNYTIADNFEDIHSQIEYTLTERLGDIGKKIHTGRSRNDQVLLDMKLYLKDEILAISEEIKTLFDLLISLSERYKDVIIPGYTHLQVAMPSSFGLFFAAYAETLIDDLRFMKAAADVINQNPLGSAASYGSSFPLDRALTTTLLNFADLHVNSLAAQFSRGKTEKSTALAVSSVAGTLASMANDLVVMMSQNFGFLTFPDEYTTGSSIMPHKKNPDVFELVRGKCNRLQSLPNDFNFLLTNLTAGYSRDKQLLKEILIPALQELRSCLRISTFALKEVIILAKSVAENPIYNYMYTVEDLNRLVIQGMSFRDAYMMIGKQVQEGTYTPNKTVNHTHIGSIGNLSNDLIIKKMEKVYHELHPKVS